VDVNKIMKSFSLRFSQRKYLTLTLVVTGTLMACLGGLGLRDRLGVLTYSEQAIGSQNESSGVIIGWGDGKINISLKRLVDVEHDPRYIERDFYILRWSSITTTTHNSGMNLIVRRTGVTVTASLCLAIAVLFYLTPVLKLTRWLYEFITRYRYGLCFKCGFDLTGNISGVCPECGTPIDPK